MAVATGLAVIALAALGAQRRAPQRHPGEGADGLLRNLLVSVLIAYLILAVLVTLVALVSARSNRTDVARRAPRSLVLWVVGFLVLSMLLGRYVRRPEPRPVAVAVASDEGRSTEVPPAPPDDAGGTEPWSVALGVALAALVVGGVVVATLRERARRSPVRTSEPNARRAAAESVDELLARLEAERDPRRAVLLADHGMELVLARHGTTRAASETAEEFLVRASHELSISADAAALLTQLYSSVHFGDASPDERARGAAIDAVRAVRDELRRTPAQGTGGPARAGFR